MSKNSTNTDPTALQCKKKFLAFIDALSSYPPMTFHEYTNWFPQRFIKDYTYLKWFYLAVLNNFPFMLRLKQRDPDAINLFELIITSGYHVYNVDYYTTYKNPWELPKDLFDEEIIDSFNFNYNCDISKLINFCNFDLQIGNINETSSAIKIANNVTTLTYKHKLINELAIKHCVDNIKILRNFYNFVKEYRAKIAKIKSDWFVANEKKIIAASKLEFDTRVAARTNAKKIKFDSFVANKKKFINELSTNFNVNKELINAEIKIIAVGKLKFDTLVSRIIDEETYIHDVIYYKRINKLNIKQREIEFNMEKFINDVKEGVNVDGINENLEKILGEKEIYKLLNCSTSKISKIVKSAVLQKKKKYINDYYSDTEDDEYDEDEIEEIFISDDVTVKSSTGPCKYINVDDISNIYAIKITSTATMYNYLKITKISSRRYITRSNNSNETLSLLMENIVDVLA